MKDFLKAPSRAGAFFLSKSSDKPHMKQTALEQFRKSLITPIPVANSTNVVECLYTFKLSVTPSEIWPYVSDTSRMNKELGFSPREEVEKNGETYVSTVTLGKAEEWVEKPWTWVHENELQNHRIFSKGWMTEHRGIFKVRPTSDGSEVLIYFRWSFSSLWKKMLFQLIAKVLEKNFREFFKNKEKLIIEERSESSPPSYSIIEPSSPYDVFLNYLKSADELDLDRIQLKKIARVINLPVDLLMDVSHTMVTDGLLSLSWDIICPHCRGTRAENQSLAYLEEINHCSACDIEFSIGPEESVEVVFHPTEKLRKVSRLTYCAAEPARKKHIKLYQPVKKDETKSYDLHLKPGKYRLRSKGSENYFYLKVEESAEIKDVSWDGKSVGELTVNPSLTVKISNSGPESAFFTIEEAWWQSESLAPGEVLSHPSLRQFFTEDHLKIGVKLNVGDQVIMFTDIVGSTPFYKELGDAAALKAVKDHYNEVREIIELHQGVVVKYIGDAVMAAFIDLKDAFEACIQIQRKFPPDRKDTPIRLRASLHRGPILCANVNVGVDYFGNTVNQSAKIQKWADAFQVAMAESDWKLLSSQYSNLEVKEPVYDEKLGLQVRVLTIL